MNKALIAIDRSKSFRVYLTISTDLTEIIEEDGEAELQCQFCCKKYHFNKDELVEILDRMG